MLAANLLTRSYAELLHRLDYAQVAPPLFLFASKFIYGILGQLEYSLRLFPLVCGCLTLVLLARILPREAPRFFAPCAVALYAFDFSHIDWATSFKQYASDEFAGALVFYAAISWDVMPRVKRYLAAAALPALVWLSYSASFVIVGLGCVAVVSAFKSQSKSRLKAPVILLISSAILWSVLFAVAAHHSMGHEVLVRNFVAEFPHRPYIAWLFGSIASLFGSSASLQFGPALALIIVFWGAVAVSRSEKWRVSLLAAGTLVAALCVSSLRVYPLTGGRLGAYWAAISLFLLAHGLSALHASFGSKTSRTCVRALSVFLVLAAAYGTITGASWLIAREEMRLVVRDLMVKAQDDVPLFVSAQARSSFRVYGSSLLERQVVCLVEWDIMPKELYRKWIDAGCPGQFWLVLSHYDFNVIEGVRDEFSPYCEVKNAIKHWDSAAYLIEIKPKEAWPPSPPESSEIY